MNPRPATRAFVAAVTLVTVIAACGLAGTIPPATFQYSVLVAALPLRSEAAVGPRVAPCVVVQHYPPIMNPPPTGTSTYSRKVYRRAKRVDPCY